MRNKSEMDTKAEEMGFFTTETLIRGPLETLQYRAKNQNWKRTAFQWAVTLNRKDSGKPGITLDYYTGCGCLTKAKPEQPQAPSVGDVLYSVLMDGFACEQSFGDWCSDLGYDTDSREALATYLACQVNYGKLRPLFDSQSEVETLRNCEH